MLVVLPISSGFTMFRVWWQYKKLSYVLKDSVSRFLLAKISAENPCNKLTNNLTIMMKLETFCQKIERKEFFLAAQSWVNFFIGWSIPKYI